MLLRSRSPPVLTETLSDKKVKIGELVELGVAGKRMRQVTTWTCDVTVPVSPPPPTLPALTFGFTKECHR